MSTENIIVELKASTHSGDAGYATTSTRRAQVTAAAGTVVIDGVTYTRTSPLRTAQDPGGWAGKTDDLPAQDAATFYPPVVGSTVQGPAPLAIFSFSGT